MQPVVWVSFLGVAVAPGEQWQDVSNATKIPRSTQQPLLLGRLTLLQDEFSNSIWNANSERSSNDPNAARSKELSVLELGLSHGSTLDLSFPPDSFRTRFADLLEGIRIAEEYAGATVRFGCGHMR
jgi:hypothetical protein